MKYAVVIGTLTAGTLLALSPMLFAQVEVHADRLFHAQWAGFIVIICSVVMGFRAIAHKDTEAKQ